MNKQLIESLKQLMTTHCSSNSNGHDNRYYIKSQVDNKIKKPEMGISIVGTDSFIMYPEGGSYHSTTTIETGYLKITFPVSWTHTMLSFQVTVYDYTINASATYHISGYTYGTGWHNVSAVCIGTYGRSLCNLPVRFGHDGSKCAITIGEVSTVWQYPQVQVHNIMTGYQSCGYNTWKTGWDIQITTTALTTINHTITNPHVANGVSIPWNSVTGKPTTFPPETHSHSIDFLSIIDKRTGLLPNSFSPKGLRVYFGPKEALSNATGITYSDIIVLNGYSDASGGMVNALCFNKKTQEIVHYQGDFGSTTWKNIKKLAYTDHTHSYLPLTGGTLTGTLAVNGDIGVQSGREIKFISSSGFTKFLQTSITSDSNFFIKSQKMVRIYSVENPGVYADGGLYIINHAGSAYAPVYASAFTVCSSKRFKENIRNITDIDALNLLKLSAKRFDYINGAKDQSGFIAEDVEHYFPEVCVAQKDNVTKKDVLFGIDYSKFSPYIIKLLQIQQKEIEELKQTITQLQQAFTPPPHNLINWKEEFSLEIAA